MRVSLALFAAVAFSPLLLIGAGAVYGGAWVWVACLWMAGASVVIDLCAPRAAEEGEFPGDGALLVAVGGAVLVSLPLVVRAAVGLGLPGGAGLLLAAGLWYGQVGHPAAHELIHRRQRPLFALGVAVYSLLLFGHHASAHRLVHHRHVASPQDPNSAAQGEGFYRFLWRAWSGSIRAGLAAERRLRGHGGPYGLYALGALAGLACGALVAGPAGVLAWAALGLHFGAQVLLSDYVQHYGLRRAEGERVGPGHSWNAPQWYSSALMLNAPRHSDHHMTPGRPYPALRLAPGMPVLPWPLPLACVVALYPPLWRRRMAVALRGLTKPCPTSP